jgi:hypothetical protein
MQKTTNKSKYCLFIKLSENGGKVILLLSDTLILWTEKNDLCFNSTIATAMQTVSHLSTTVIVKYFTHLWHSLEEHQRTPAHHTSFYCFVQAVTVEIPARLTYECLTWKITATATLSSGQHTQLTKTRQWEDDDIARTRVKSVYKFLTLCVFFNFTLSLNMVIKFEIAVAKFYGSDISIVLGKLIRVVIFIPVEN